jgi:hypothetical protein
MREPMSESVSAKPVVSEPMPIKAMHRAPSGGERPSVRREVPVAHEVMTAEMMTGEALSAGVAEAMARESVSAKTMSPEMPEVAASEMSAAEVSTSKVTTTEMPTTEMVATSAKMAAAEMVTTGTKVPATEMMAPASASRLGGQRADEDIQRDQRYGGCGREAHNAKHGGAPTALQAERESAKFNFDR